MSIARLYGLTVHQTFRYFRMYPDDARFLQATVRTCGSEYLLTRFLIKHKGGSPIVSLFDCLELVIFVQSSVFL